MKSKYLEINLSSDNNLKEDMVEQMTKAGSDAGYLNDRIWRNNRLQ